jgi:cyclophilin family peptidyl-prolyl cis-trans isomerase/HEAT repeat protein
MKSWIVLSILAFLAPGKSYATSKGKPAGDADLYRLVEIEDHRDGRDPFLKEALAGKNPQLTARALLALGRIGEPEAAALVAPYLQNAVMDVRLNAAFALGLIKQPESLKVLEEALGQEKDPKVRAQIYMALGRLQISAALSVLEKALTQEQQALAQSGLAMGFCFLFLAPESASWAVNETTLATLTTQMKAAAPLGIAAAWALARYKGELNHLSEKELATAISEAREPEAKALALKALSRHKTPATADVLKALLKNGESHNMRVEAASGLAGHAVEKALIQSLLEAAGRDVAIVRAAALITLATYQNLDEATQKTLEEMTRTQPSPWLQGKAYLALIPQLPEGQRRDVILKGLAHPDVYVQREIIAILPQLGAEGLTILSRKATDPSILIAGAAVSALRDLDKEQMNDDLKKIMLDQLSRRDPVISSTVIDAAGKFAWKDALPLLIQTAHEKWKAEDFSIHENLMGTLISFNDPSTLPLIEKNLQHPVRNVVLKAAEAWQKVSGKTLDKTLPVNNRVDEVTPALASIKKALDSEVVLETSKGTIRMVMLKEAPLTATKIVQWVQKGFYNGLNFHRVVPHWVVQGGDPRGDGEGGDGMIRDEVSMAPHAPYSVGIATSGKDTGSTQMFFNLGDNTRLDGAYTVFAQVIDGRDVVDRLELGDRIIKATVQPFRGL